MLYDDLPWLLAFACALARGAARVDRSILEHLLKPEQIIAIRWRMSMANSPQLGGAERTGNNGHSVLDWFSQNNMPLGGTSQESRGMPAPFYGQCPNIGRGESGAYVQVVGKTEFVTTGLWRPTCSNRNRRSGYLKEVGEMTRLKMHWQLVQTDGRKHLDMAWEAAKARVVPSVSLPQIYRSARQE